MVRIKTNIIYLILLIILIVGSVIAIGDSLTDRTVDKATLFPGLKSNDADNAQAVFQVNNSELVSKDSFKIKFNEVCGHVNSYQIMVNSNCSKTVEYTDIKTSSCDIKNVYNDSTKVFDNVCPTPCHLEGKDCILETDTVMSENINYSCYKPFNEVPTGVNDYFISADISWAICKNTGILGYEIDWVPCLNVTNPLTSMKTDYCQNDWAWWNVTYTNRYNIINRTTKNMPMLINGTNGYSINGVKNYIWFNPTNLTGSPAIYNGSSNIYSVANDTTEGAFDNPRGGLNRTPTMIYNGTVVMAMHFEQNGTWNGTTNTGNWLDSSGRSTGVDYSGGLLYAGSPKYVNASKVGGAYNFTSTTKVIVTNSAAQNKGSDESITFLMWLYFDVDQEQGPFGKKDGSSTGYFMYTGGGGYLQAGMRTDLGTGCDVNLAGAFSTGRWYHVAWVVDDSVPIARIYLNGTEVANVSSAHCGGDSSNTDPFRFGTEQNQYGTPFGGIIDEFRLYKRALTQEEIMTDYNNSMNLNNLLSASEVAAYVDIYPPVISISSPADYNWTNDNTPPITFTATDDSNASFRCDVTFNANYTGYNVATTNNTPTTITVNISLAYFNVYTYGVNCTDGTNIGQNDSRTMYIFNGTGGGTCDLGCISIKAGCYATAGTGCTLITS
jgi:hypothetical protein